MPNWENHDKPIKQTDLDKFFEWLKFVNQGKAIEFYELMYRFEHNGMYCFCCTCTYDDDDKVIGWDAACRMHGAHGQRGCEYHRQPDVNCDCGCGDKITEEKEKENADAEG